MLIVNVPYVEEGEGKDISLRLYNCHCLELLKCGRIGYIIYTWGAWHD